MADWQKTIKKMPIKIKAAPHWMNTIRPAPPKVIQGKDGTDFKFEDHKDKISQILQAHVSEVKPQLLSDLSKLIKDQVSQLKPKAGENGKDSNRFHLVSSLNDDFGQNDDLALMEKTLDLFIKKDGEWVLKASLRSRNQAVMTGGVSAQYVNDQIAAAGGGSSTQIIGSADSDLTITTQDILICRASVPITISLKALATAVKPVTIKNRSPNGSLVTVLVDGGGDIDDETIFNLSNNAGLSFVPEGGEYNVFG